MATTGAKTTGAAMERDFYVEAVSSSGTHQCIVEGYGRSVWMYLHDLQSRQVIADAPLCSLKPPTPLAEFRRTYQRGQTPPLVREYATDSAEITEISDLTLTWGDDGSSVAACLHGVPIAMVLADQKAGYSKAVSKEGPWGRPWDNDAYVQRFGSQLPT